MRGKDCIIFHHMFYCLAVVRNQNEAVCMIRRAATPSSQKYLKDTFFW